MVKKDGLKKMKCNHLYKTINWKEDIPIVDKKQSWDLECIKCGYKREYGK